MNDAEWTRAGALYVPVVLALLAGALQTNRHKLFAACLVSGLWALSSLLVLQVLNEWAGWWTYASTGILFRRMPLELYLGWVLLWGLVPQLAIPRLAIGWCAAIMVGVDLVAMPACTAVVRLGPSWLVGEAVAVVLVLIPALCLARWTLDDTNLFLRSAMQLAMSSTIFLCLLPEAVFALRPGEGWGPLVHYPSWQRQLALQAIGLLAMPGVSAVMEFAERGWGTPIPYDPPKRLVISGIYRYCANPMQLSCGLVMAAWALLLRNGWLALAAGLSFIYSAGIAHWDESEDLERRFGMQWKQYRSAVPNWLPRWRPYYTDIEARLYIAASCGPCSELRRWIEDRKPLGLRISDAEELPNGAIRRLRYEPGDGSDAVEGVRALGRALEHLHLGWALSGATLRLPGIWQVVQLFMDSSGLGPRSLGEVF